MTKEALENFKEELFEMARNNQSDFDLLEVIEYFSDRVDEELDSLSLSEEGEGEK